MTSFNVDLLFKIEPEEPYPDLSSPTYWKEMEKWLLDKYYGQPKTDRLIDMMARDLYVACEGYMSMEDARENIVKAL
ncbi:hypothetical protein Ab1vBOLIVR5_gp59c [Agrobacterium phage OLIVR5]|uniref:Uncharacterized protein n=1 Tax=Agrobacterium phage OLIVR5 TaxID=2723773 RepID=A0A858MSF0_9CAUD|nr:hypothetical protein KNU99_gp059 [Agrobacterium phage OLIVR5]QIW87707.1 hypothetical protein Ab1vBOLIVR5_gp59c [Agrobacterium phage OLIVR5]QIW87969.1 hypothetical protein Ab1vBOLIVR6_gp62c [Agrobacterium phage OLIVR6]